LFAAIIFTISIDIRKITFLNQVLTTRSFKEL